MAAHLDQATHDKIINNEYVDFAKLLPKDKVLVEHDNRMEMVNKGGLTYWVPVTEREVTAINNLGKWEQAFRVYANVYTKRFPCRAAKLIEYNHVIHAASQTYIWEKVAIYDRDFRLHMSRHPERSWSIILQQAWSMRLKDRFKFIENNRSEFAGSGRSNFKRERDICRKFNRGKCTYGFRYKYGHRCNTCLEFGDGSHICIKNSDNSEAKNKPYDEHERRREKSPKAEKNNNFQRKITYLK